MLEVYFCDAPAKIDEGKALHLKWIRLLSKLDTVKVEYQVRINFTRGNIKIKKVRFSPQDNLCIKAFQIRGQDL